jgi:hypothetical protein
MTPVATDRFGCFLHLLPVGNVTRQRERLTAAAGELSNGIIQFVLIARGDRDSVPLPSKRLRQSPSQTPASTGDKNRFLLYGHQRDN